MLTASQYAMNILDAWKAQDQSGLGAALEAASSLRAVPASSRLESERGELLESIVDHLRRLSSQDQHPAASGSSGAMALLAHLRSNAGATQVIDDFSKGGKTL